jgi:hypothetical protein
MRKAIVGGELLVLLIIGIGVGQLGFLVGMDAQTVKLQKKGRCDSRHYVHGVYPKFNKQTGKIERIAYKTPCDEWAKRFK